MRVFSSVLIVGTLIVFVGCKKSKDADQESPAVEVQPATHAEPEDQQQQTTLPAVESTAPIEHEVIAIVREFFKAIDGGDYDRAIELGTPNEFKKEGLIKTNEAFDFTNVEIAEAYVGIENAAVLTNSVPAPTATIQFGLSLVKTSSRWLIRDVDMLPRDDAIERWLAGFKGVEPNAKRIVGED